ncbi:acid phosphatase [Bartonella sp. LJL80]
MRSIWFKALVVPLFAGAFISPQALFAQTLDPASQAGVNAPFSRLDLSHYPEPGQKDNFLTMETAPDSLALLPPPPKDGSAAFEADVAAYKAGLAIRNTARGEQARQDADLSPRAIGKAFSQALGVEISPSNTPITYNLMYRLVDDLGGPASDKAKQHYMRVRPFVRFKTHSCQPDKDEEAMRKNGSYPSGHTAYGWGFALILAEIKPERQDAILQRGYEFGQSRVICGAHWQSDVTSGRIIGAAAVAKLHTMPAFVRELAAAKSEIAALGQKENATVH